jgi:ABC-2 type transport system permease protein
MSTAASVHRILTLLLSDVRMAWKRPLTIVLFAIMSFSSFGLVAGGLTVSTGSADTAGMKAWINSEFNIAFVDVLMLSLIAPFFAAVACGTAATNDEERKFDRILHATPLSPLEYVIGRFVGALAPVLLALVAWKVVQMGFYELYPVSNPEKVRGPFTLVAYVRPFGFIVLPLLVLMGGGAFFLGTLTRQAALVFALPTALFLIGVFFLWNFSPEWLPEWVNVLLQWLDPAGFRWLSENFLTEDRGAAFYNTTPMALGFVFGATRLAHAFVGLAAVLATSFVIHRRVRGSSPRVALESLPRPAAVALAAPIGQGGGLPEMTQRDPGFLAATWAVLRKEIRWLLRSPGIYIFGPLILLQVVGSSILRQGPLDTFVLHSSGTLAASAFNTLTLLLVLLVLYYTVESLTREERHNVSRIVRSTAAPTISLLAGKVLANALLGGVIVGAAFLAAVIILLVQGLKTPIEPAVFALVWGVILAPTLILWSAFVTFLQAALRNRYATYVVALGLLILTGFLTQFGYIGGGGGWHLWSGVIWSDLDRLELHWPALMVNRLAALLLSITFVVLALRLWPRRVADARSIADRLRPGRLFRASLVPALAALPPAVLIVGMLVAMRAGRDGSPLERKAKDYWRQNSATWEDAPVPSLEELTAEVDLQPVTRSLSVKGTMVVRNRSGDPMDAIPISVREHLRVSKWTLDGEEMTPVELWDRVKRPSIENRTNLFLFRSADAIPPGGAMRIGFELEGDLPFGWSKRPGGASEFVLPSGVVLTSFSGSFLPSVGFAQGVGVDEKNQRETRDLGPNHWRGRVDPLFGPAWSSNLSLTVTAPADWTINCVGVAGEERIEGARKTTVWTSDHPVRFFNIVGGPLLRQAGENTSVFYNERHPANVERMSKTLDAARKYYSEWFHPYPWRDLKLTEFPGLATYAQGFPGNITFSEAIGFLTKDAGAEEADVVTFVVAHESAHQWWGNILTPGRGPGGNVLSEGMANFSAAMLIDRIESPAKRRSLMRKYEDQYANQRKPDNERSLHRVDGSRPGDTTVMYDRGGFVFWMMKEMMGEEAMLAGLRDFIERFKDGPDFPLVEDFVEVLREHATDKDAYNAFVDQWVLGTVVPEFEFSNVKAEREGEEYVLQGSVRNIGTGLMLLDIAALRTKDKPDGKRALTTVAIEPGVSVPFTMRTDFEPVQVVADPEVKLLQIRRKQAVADVE